MIEATRQSLVDARTIAAWLLEQGCPIVGLWGFSLGAWLAGLLVCHDSRFLFGVLLTPVPNVEMAVRELDFCAPIRAALQAHSLDVSRLNLGTLRPQIPPEDILIIEAKHDMFAPPQVVDEFWDAWGRPPIWRVSHGHISILMSLRIMERTVQWIAGTNRRLPRNPQTVARS